MFASISIAKTQVPKNFPIPSFFLTFFLKKEMKQKRQSESLGGDETLDLVNYIEFQNYSKAAKRFHNKALRAIRSFWRLLLEDNVNIADLPRAFKFIDTAESKAKQYYIQLLERYPKSVRILRAYAQFMEDILNDHTTADQYYYKADMIEDSKSKIDHPGKIFYQNKNFLGFFYELKKFL